MTSIAKLKDRARKHEQKEDWKAAIEAYQQVLEKEQGEDELELELGLFNRIGDLYLRLNQTDQAVSYYEQAADKYAEAGFFNNAIALCNKALRHRPGRSQIYLKLSRLCAEQGFVTDARRWILDYAEREVKAGRLDAALNGLSDFVETSADPDVREFLAAQLATHGREADAAQQYARAYGERMAAGQTDAAERAAKQARSIDPSIDLDAAVAAAPAYDEPLPFTSDGEEEAADAGGLSGLETRPEPALEPDVPEVGGLEGLEATAGGALAGEEEAALEDEPASLGGLETFGEVELGQADEDAGVGPGAEEEEAEPLPLMEEEAEPLPLLSTESAPDELDGEDEEEAEPLPMLDAGEEGALEIELEPEPPEEEPVAEPVAAEPVPEPAAEDVGAMDLDALDVDLGEPPGPAGAAPEPGPELVWEAEPEGEEPAGLDADAVLARARDLAARGLSEEALRELDALAGPETGPDVWRDALGVVDEIVRQDADDIEALQRRVEYAAQIGGDDLLVGAYLDLAAALGRMGAADKARVMYERVLDLEPDNATALEATQPPAGVAGGSGPAGAPAESEMDMDSLLLDMGSEDAAAPVSAEGPLLDEVGDPEFVALLSQFKARVTENPDAEDAGDHYDLGLAFKEMGLVDEAIAEFQTALSGGEERLKVYEELGQCFILKSEYTVALKIFDRALQVPHEDPAELLGVYYHLGHCHEQLGHREKARDAYEKVLAIDPSFQDVPDRMARL